MGAVREVLALLARGRSDEMTNADMIRQMTDEHEMERFMLKLCRKAKGYTDTMLGLVELLKQEVEE
jgi:hypothetical protein